MGAWARKLVGCIDAELKAHYGRDMPYVLIICHPDMDYDPPIVNAISHDPPSRVLPSLKHAVAYAEGNLAAAPSAQPEESEVMSFDMAKVAAILEKMNESELDAVVADLKKIIHKR